eukprot:TRINITY_DN10468_c0_g1_i1.p1 TRINITY_DN10468_c0_g1~~TRINITY_DN10468_c0_g1_i1.p1  ORF type:complete len:649 (+),score=109.06 TRINITY_DN10468_c0_g1_i1:66-2012(+)
MPRSSSVTRPSSASQQAAVAAAVERLLTAVRENNGSAVRSALREGAPIDGCDDQSNTALHWACCKGNDKLVQYLLKHKANPALANSSGLTPLHCACRNGHAQVAELLLACKGVGCNAGTKRGITALHYACATDAAQVVAALLRSSEIAVNLADGNGNSPLHIAAIYGHSQVAAELLRQRTLDVNARNLRQATPLHLASHNGHAVVVHALLCHRAVDPDLRMDNSDTALHLACHKGKVDVVRQLLTHPRVDINARNQSTGSTAIHVSASRGDYAMVQLLLTIRGIDVNLTDVKGLTPLAVTPPGAADVIQALRAAGATGEVTSPASAGGAGTASRSRTRGTPETDGRPTRPPLTPASPSNSIWDSPVSGPSTGSSLAPIQVEDRAGRSPTPSASPSYSDTDSASSAPPTVMRPTNDEYQFLQREVEHLRLENTRLRRELECLRRKDQPEPPNFSSNFDTDDYTSKQDADKQLLELSSFWSEEHRRRTAAEQNLHEVQQDKEDLEAEYQQIALIEHAKNAQIVAARQAAVAAARRGARIPIKVMGAMDEQYLMRVGIEMETITKLRFEVRHLMSHVHGAAVDASESTRLRETYGPVAAAEVERAALELEQWNPSGFYPVPVPWHFKLQRELEPAEIIQLVTGARSGNSVV